MRNEVFEFTAPCPYCGQDNELHFTKSNAMRMFRCECGEVIIGKWYLETVTTLLRSDGNYKLPSRDKHLKAMGFNTMILSKQCIEI